MAARGYLGSGDLFIERLVGGVSQGLMGPYECSQFEITPNSETRELVSKGRTTYGQVIETVNVPQPAELSVTLTEVNKESLAIALFGTASVLSQTAGSWTTAIDVVTKHGQWVALPKGAVLTLVAKDSTSTVTYVENVDYLLNKEMGWIKTLATGNIDPTETLKVTGTYDDIAGTKIAGMTNNDVRAKFILQGRNFADSLPTIVTVHEAVISASSAFDFLSDDFAQVVMPGRMKTPAGFTEPFTVELRDAA